MALGYRAILRLDASEDAVKMAEDQVRSWLREKSKKDRRKRKFADWDGPGHYDFGQGASLTVVRSADDRDGSTRQLLRFQETNPSGRWVVSVVACSLPNARREQQSLLVELSKEGVSLDEALTDAKPPRLVTHLLESGSVRDSATVLTSTPRMIRVDDVTEVLDAILDQGRLASVVVAVSPGGVPDESWRDIVAQLTNDSRGVSTAFIISDAAVEEFESRLPYSHAVTRGSVRTFAPRVDLARIEDGVRHRVLGAGTFARSIQNGKVRGPLLVVHAQRARRRLVEAELPAEIRRALDVLRREEVAIIRDSRVGVLLASEPKPIVRVLPRPSQTLENPARTGAEWLKASVGALLRRWLGVADVTEESIGALGAFIAKSEDGYSVAKEQIDSLLSDQSQLQIQMEQLREELEEAELAAAIESDEARKAAREARILRERLRAAKQFDDVLVGPEEPQWDPPSDIEELLLRLDPEVSDSPVAKYLQFTGSESPAKEIMKRDQLGRIVGKMWEFALVLHDYAELRSTGGYQGSVHQYLTDPEVTSRKCSPQRHAAGESETVTTNAKMSRERVFPVPKSVDKRGEMTMLAHFKPNSSDTFAPRMYYFDDMAKSGKIYIGYVGRHLTNSKTN